MDHREHCGDLSPCRHYFFAGSTLCCSSGRSLEGTFCEACPGGQRGSSAATTCSQGNACTTCDAGFHCPNEGTAFGDQVPCPSGKWSAVGAASCDNCNAGRYGGGQSTQGGCDGPCEEGHYCPPGTSSATANPCGVGFYCPAEASAQSGIEEGYFGTGGTATTRTGQQQCVAGEQCVSFERLGCPPGRYSDSAGATRCELCAAGRYGTGASSSSACSGECTEGYFCLEGSNSATQNECGAGHFCEQGSGEATDASVGFYVTGGATATTHTGQSACTPTYACQGGLRQLCTAGEYSGSQATTCSACPAGRYGTGPSGTSDCEGLCNAGRVGRGEDTTADCTDACPAGYFCPAGTGDGNLQRCNRPTHYCPRGSSTELPVGTGYFGVLDGNSNYDQRSQCQPGEYCAGGLKEACPTGRYSDGPGAAGCAPCPAGVYGAGGSPSAACTRPCRVGHYCPEGTPNELDCGGAALYCPQGSSAPLAVPAGSRGTGVVPNQGGTEACPAGSGCSNGVATSCDPGFYSEEGASFCPPCAAGHFGANPGASSSACDGQCTAGYYCPAGSTSATQNVCGGPGVYCPAGSGLALVPTTGYFAAGSVSGNTKHTREEPCQPGEFCEAGIKQTCPAGQYSSAQGSTGCSDCDGGRVGGGGDVSAQCAGPCPAGFACGIGTAAGGGSACTSASSFCVEGTQFPTTVPPGSFSVQDESGRSVNMAPCTPGYACNGGVRAACAVGEFATGGSGTCTACPAGRYGGGASPDNTCSGPCTAGFVCPEGSSTPANSPCGAADTFCPEGSGAPSNVAAGFYGTGGGLTTRTGAAPCEPGHACVGGIKTQCAPGRFAPAQAVNCTPCPLSTWTDGVNPAGACTDCAVGFHTLGLGAMAASDCIPIASPSPSVSATPTNTPSVTASSSPSTTAAPSPSITTTPLPPDLLVSSRDCGGAGLWWGQCDPVPSTPNTSVLRPLPGVWCQDCERVGDLMGASAVESCPRYGGCETGGWRGGQLRCGEGHTGPLCAACQEGFTPAKGSPCGYCEPCSQGSDAPVVLLSVGGCIVVLGLVALSVLAIKDRGSLQQDLLIGAARITVGYFAIIGYISIALQPVTEAGLGLASRAISLPQWQAACGREQGSHGAAVSAAAGLGNFTSLGEAGEVWYSDRSIFESGAHAPPESDASWAAGVLGDTF